LISIYIRDERCQWEWKKRIKKRKIKINIYTIPLAHIFLFLNVQRCSWTFLDVSERAAKWNVHVNVPFNSILFKNVHLDSILFKYIHLRYVFEHSAKWIVHLKVCLRSFTLKNIYVNERSWLKLNVNGGSRERLCPCTFGNVRRRSKKEDVRERYSI